MIDLEKLGRMMPEEKQKELRALLANAPASLMESAEVVHIAKSMVFIDAGEESGIRHFP